ncbi:unnamed protein product [Cyclocybe aegerita]|uniref:Uncharacterized protein n=1 Tax=Cyclocybe aegerita TaxID=1973307 RepID=A0A8S0X5Y0_CYCAE|nr:unnamed protein product [Cyclocybe aegerita]
MDSMALFDPAARLPRRLQSRLDSWYTDPPKSQFQVYGPLNGYLQGHKFTTTKFLVKPQALLREEDASNTEADTTGSDDAPDDNDNDGDGNNSDNDNDGVGEDEDEYEDGYEDGDGAGDRSFDSQGVSVTDEKKYPDFTICQYWGPDLDINPKADIIRVIIEVGSDERMLWQVYRKTVIYLEWAGKRWHGEVLGIAIVKNRVSLIRNNPTGGGFYMLYDGWISIFDRRFVEELNRIHRYSIEADRTAWN